MWAGGRDINDLGESVILLEPSSTKPTSSCKKKRDPSASFLGGTPAFFEEADVKRPICGVCKQETHLILQMNAPFGELDRTMYVFGCNDASCFSKAFDSERVLSSSTDDDKTGSRFCLGGNGIIHCLRSQTGKQEEKNDADYNEPHTEEEKCTQKKKTSEPAWDDTMSWGDDEGGGWGDNDNDDWGTSSENVIDETKTSMDDLEAMLAAMETANEEKVQEVKTTKSSPIADIPNTKFEEVDTGPSFPRYDLIINDEPATQNTLKAEHGEADSDDEDVVHDKSDAKIQNLLSKYLEQEEDTDIVRALKGVGNEKGGSAEIKGEKYERLPPKDRTFMAFSTRVKRAPKQSVRYAYDGIPFWSIPTPLSNKGKRGGQSRDLNFPYNQVPPCSCGSQRTFEFQIMPSILYTLDVDRYSRQHAQDSKSNQEKRIDCVMRKDFGGMNWGTIAVFSCARSCESYRDEYVIIQESVDATPKLREQKKPPIDDNSNA